MILLFKVTLLFAVGWCAALLLARRSASARHFVWALTLTGALALSLTAPLAPVVPVRLAVWPAAPLAVPAPATIAHGPAPSGAASLPPSAPAGPAGRYRRRRLDARPSPELECPNQERAIPMATAPPRRMVRDCRATSSRWAA